MSAEARVRITKKLGPRKTVTREPRAEKKQNQTPELKGNLGHNLCPEMNIKSVLKEKLKSSQTHAERKSGFPTTGAEKINGARDTGFPGTGACVLAFRW